MKDLSIRRMHKDIDKSFQDMTEKLGELRRKMLRGLARRGKIWYEEYRADAQTAGRTGRSALSLLQQGGPASFFARGTGESL